MPLYFLTVTTTLEYDGYSVTSIFAENHSDAVRQCELYLMDRYARDESYVSDSVYVGDHITTFHFDDGSLFASLLPDLSR